MMLRLHLSLDLLIIHSSKRSQSSVRSSLSSPVQTVRVLPPTSGQLTVLAFREGCSYRKRLEQYLDHVGIQSRKVIELGTLDGILGCVAAGLGIAMVPRTVIGEGRYNVAIHEILGEFSHVPTVLVRRKDGFMSSAFRRFIQTVQQNETCAQPHSLPEHTVS